MQKVKSGSAAAAARRRRLGIIAGLVGLAVLGVAGLYLYLFHSPRPWVVRWQTERYLKRQTGNRDFSVNFPFPSKAEMAKALPKPDKKDRKGTRTGKDYETLRNEYFRLKSAILRAEGQIVEGEEELAMRTNLVPELEKQLAEAISSNSTNVDRLSYNLTNQLNRIVRLQTELPQRREALKQIPDWEKELAPITADLWEFQRQWAAEMAAWEAASDNALARARAQFVAEQRKKLDEAKSYTAIYRVIGEQLYVAKRLLDSANANHRRIGMSMVLQAMQYTWTDAQNNWLAARIAEGYIWPNLDVAEEERRSQLSLDALINSCVGAFRANNENDKIIRTYERLVAVNPQRADWARFQIARTYEQDSQWSKALNSYRAIQNTNDFRGLAWNIQNVERRLNVKR